MKQNLEKVYPLKERMCDDVVRKWEQSNSETSPLSENLGLRSRFSRCGDKQNLLSADWTILVVGTDVPLTEWYESVCYCLRGKIPTEHGIICKPQLWKRALLVEARIWLTLLGGEERLSLERWTTNQSTRRAWLLLFINSSTRRIHKQICEDAEIRLISNLFKRAAKCCDDGICWYAWLIACDENFLSAQLHTVPRKRFPYVRNTRNIEFLGETIPNGKKRPNRDKQEPHVRVSSDVFFVLRYRVESTLCPCTLRILDNVR